MSGAANKKKKRRRRSGVSKPNRWQRSQQWREIGRAAITKFNASRPRLPKCGALARSTGEPCKQLALANGRCRWHGGTTPKGEQHGVRQFAGKPRSQQTENDWPRAQAKLDRFAREDADRVRRLARMTDAEFITYCRRTASRRDRQFRKIVDKESRRRSLTKSQIMGSSTEALFPVRETGPDTAEVAALKYGIARLKRALEVEPEQDPMPREGVFA